MTNAPTFTAARYAAALGVSPQAIRKALRGVAPSGKVLAGGQLGDAWAVDVLTPALRERLNAMATKEKFRSVETMLAADAQQFPLSDIGRDRNDDEWTAAQKLQRALLPSLQRLHEPMSAEDFDRTAIKDYRREYGREVTARYIRELLAMVRRADSGREDWSRLEIYLPEKTKAQESAPPAPVKDELPALAAYVAQCAHPARLTELERRGLWAHACEEHDRLVAEGCPESEAARTVRDALAALTPFADVNRHALRMQFSRKLELWREEKKTTALRDKREDNGSPVVLAQKDYDEIIASAGKQFRGQVAPAVRYLLGAEKLSAPFQRRYGHLINTRGDCPEHILEQCGYKAWLYYMHRMEKLDEETGSTERDWNAMPSLRVYSADDLTACVYSYVTGADGRFRLVRGQLLVFEDYSTGMILGYSLQPDAQYNSLVIRSLCTHVFAKYGVPTGLYFENGMWRSARLIKGSKTQTLSNAEMTRGLEDLGIRFTHTKHPWSKPIEKSFDLLQTLMQSEPGYCGREEKYDLPPELKRAKELISRNTKPVHPAELGLYSFDEWKIRVGELCEQFNRTPQHGARCGGLSPAEACEKRLLRNDPNMTFTPQVRHLLALHREPRQVKASGINFEFGRRTFRYRSEELGQLNGQTVMTGFDSENPEMLTVEDPATGLVLCVPLHEKVHPSEGLFDDQSGTLAREQSRIEGQVAGLRAYFKVLDCGFPLPVRKVIADPVTIENGRRIELGRQAIREQKKLTERARSVAARTGLLVNPANLTSVSAEECAEFDNYLKGDQ